MANKPKQIKQAARPVKMFLKSELDSGLYFAKDRTARTTAQLLELARTGDIWVWYKDQAGGHYKRFGEPGTL